MLAYFDRFDYLVPFICKQLEHFVLRFVEIWVFREANDASTAPSTCEFSVDFPFHTRRNYVVDFGTAHAKFLQVLLIHGDVVPNLILVQNIFI